MNKYMWEFLFYMLGFLGFHVLRSIYEGDSAFTIHSDTKFQYKMGSQESDRYKSFDGIN